jgi:hypothetical protein
VHERTLITPSGNARAEVAGLKIWAEEDAMLGMLLFLAFASACGGRTPSMLMPHPTIHHTMSGHGGHHGETVRNETFMFELLANELTRVVDAGAQELRAIDDELARNKPRPDVWSVKEILGHLIDSAANNHQRFVRAQLATELSFPGYEQDEWVRSQDHQGRPWSQLVDLWVHYNYHLAHVIRRIQAAAAGVPIRIGGSRPLTLNSLAADYVAHLRHHLEQIQARR